MLRDVTSILEDHGINPSAQRVAVAQYVLNTVEHPSADEVWTRVRERFPHVSRATVYNTLNLLVEKRLLRQFVLTEGRIVFDPHTDDHHHFIDEDSGTIHDVPSGSTTSIAWPGRIPGIEHEWYVTVSDGSRTTTGPLWTFTTVSPLTYELELSPGWNLVSWPLAAVSGTITDTVLSSCSTCDQAWTYDASDVADPWKYWPGTLDRVDETMGLWLHTTEPASVAITGWQPIGASIELRAGRNLVGYPSQTTRPVAEALSSIVGQ